ncbi:alpha-2-antiplasmin [Alligator sinensis]|uniref:Alpha-2-antiplasmin n=1 Tax=Alligator sinensis TaxID=38654 RepID=A0A1U8DRB1_ALLSI|nr:alpha-2-antiplasmin [Alligator sinensis]XP_014379795.1 alpha-2-antiplasmin [Alligator sinensis]XP_025070364.1 alpha-2-antiplasmin [Alligator sinensis]
MAVLLWGLLLLCLSALHHRPWCPLAYALEMDFTPSLHQDSSQGHEATGTSGQDLQPTVTSVTLPAAVSTLPNAVVSDSTSDTWEDIHGPTLPPTPTPTTTTTTTTVCRDKFMSPEGEPVTGTVGSHEQVLEGQEVDSSEEEEERNCNISQERMRKLADGLMKFTADLLQEVERENSQPNMVLSPLSITLALSHLALGAENQTEKHLLEAMHLKSVPCLHHTLSSIRRVLTESLLSVASQLYLQKGLEVKEKFLENSERFYGAKPVTLSGNKEDDLIAINKWVQEVTKGHISSFLSQLPDSMVMLLLNAVYFRGFWRNKFDASLTGPDMFHLNDEFMVPVEMMKAPKYSLSWFTLDSLEMQVARFPFKGNMSFVAIVPNQFGWNVSEVLENVSHDKLHGRFPKEKPTLVKMPKMHVDYKLELNEVLSRLGLKELFSAPDLRKITNEPLLVSSIQHQSTLELAEEGVEASAATSIMLSRSLSTFSLDRPFLFIIFEETTGIPLFVGKIQNPNPSAAQQRKEPEDVSDVKSGLKDSPPK